MATPHYNVAPRYTAGSPAIVDARTAERVAAQEKNAIVSILESYEGERAAERARRLGLRGIVECRTERGSGKKLGWDIVDLCTEEHFFRLCAEALRKLGWRAYADLDEYERKLVDQSPPTDVEDPTQAMYKVEPVLGAGFPTGWNIRVYRPEKVT